MPFSFDDIPSQEGRTVCCTGGNSGLGEVSCHQLALKGAKVYMASRSGDKAREAIERIRAQDAAAAERIEWLELDLADLASVKRAAEKLQASTDRLDILLNNAGVMGLPYSFTKDGLEMQNGTNVVGHYLFTLLLLPLLARTAQLPGHKNGHSVRIVQLSSLAHQFAPGNASWKDLDSVNGRYGFEAVGTWKRYGMSKQGNILLAKRFKAELATAGIEGITNVAVHPGAVSTNLLQGARQSWGILGAPTIFLMKKLFVTPNEGTLTSLYAATSADIDDKKLDGEYLVPTARRGRPNAAGQDVDGKRGEELMRFCAVFVKEKVDVDFDTVIKSAKEATAKL